MNVLTDPKTDYRLFPHGYPVLDKDVTGRWHCIPLQPGLQVQIIDISLHRNLPVVFNRSDPHMEFGCLFSGKLQGSLKSDNGKTQYFCNNPGQLWCSLSSKARGSIEYLSESPVYSVSFIVHGALLDNLLSVNGVLPKPLLSKNSPREFATLRPLTSGVMQTAGLITKAIEQPAPSQHLFLISKAYELLFQILTGNEKEESGPKAWERQNAVDCARRLLDENLAAPPSLEMLARKSGLCVTYLTEAFKTTYGTTVFGYVRRQRLSRARELIAVGGLTASDAAWEVGYSSISSFHRAFLAEYGTTPGSYRRHKQSR